MSKKPEGIPRDTWDYSAAVEHVYCGCAPGRSRTNGTSHHDSCWKKVEAHARAILAAEKRGEERERAACAALIKANMLCGDDGSEVLLPRSNPGNKVGLAYADAIFNRDVSATHKTSGEA